MGVFCVAFLGGGLVWQCILCLIFLLVYSGQMEKKKCQRAVLSLLSVSCSSAVVQRIGKCCVSTFAKESSTEHVLPPSSSWQGQSRRQHGWHFNCITFGNKTALVTGGNYCCLMHIVVFVQVCSCCRLICCLGICCQTEGRGLFPFVLTAFWNNEGVILDTKWKKELYFPLSTIHVSLVVSGQKKSF